MTRTVPRLGRLRAPTKTPRTSLGWWLPLALAAGIYFWTATSGGNGAPLAGEKTDYYNLLADGFEHGHLYLPVKPDPRLLALPDPYDPAQNAPYRLHDASLYKDHYYLYFGPVPALLAFLPWRLLPLGGDLPGNLAAALFGLIGLAFTLLLLRYSVRRWLPETPPWMVATAAVALTVSNLVPFVLRRPLFYEQAITAGYAFSAAAAWLLITGLWGEPRSLRRIGLASLCIGLAVGCRPNLGVLAAALLVAVVLLWRDGVGRVRTLVVALGPFGLCVLALMAYNAARFGNPAELGQSYQLAGVDVRTKEAYKLAYLVPGLFFYLVAPARHDIVFPFFHITPSPHYPWSLPAGYDTTEAVGGVFANVPITILALGALILPWHRRIGLPNTLGRVLFGSVALMLVLIAFVSVLFWATTERYEVDTAWMLALAGLLVWIALTQRLRGRVRVRRLVLASGVALIAWGAAFSLAISLTGYYDNLKSGSPSTYRTLADLAGPLQTAAAVVAGKPLMLEVNNATLESRGPGERYISSATFLKGAQTPGPAEVIVVSPSDRTVRLKGGLQQSAPGTRLRIGGAAGGPQEVPVGSGVLDLRVRLRRGLNTLRFAPIPARDVRVTDLRFR